MVVPKKENFTDEDLAIAHLAKAISHPARVAILKLLAARDSCICGEIVEELPLSQSTVSQHLKALKDAGLIQGEIEGPKTCYCLNKSKVLELQKVFPQFVKRICAGFESRKRCC